MAAVANSALATAEGRRSSSSSRRVNLSHGRGGAGNIGSSPNEPITTPETLATPTLKSEVYTTGRGGSGNMAKNNDPEATRRAQDVEANPRRESTSSAHVGRGGAANVFKPSKEDIEKARRENARLGGDSAVVFDDGSSGRAGRKGLADRGKDWLLGKTSS